MLPMTFAKDSAEYIIFAGGTNPLHNFIEKCRLQKIKQDPNLRFIVSYEHGRFHIRGFTGRSKLPTEEDLQRNEWEPLTYCIPKDMEFRTKEHAVCDTVDSAARFMRNYYKVAPREAVFSDRTTDCRN